VVEAAVRQAGDIDGAVRSLSAQGVGALNVLGDPLTYTSRRQIVSLAERARLQTVFGPRQFCDVGGLLRYAEDLTQMFRDSADYVDHILRGAAPGDLAMKLSVKYELSINLKTARDIAVPREVIARADDVIE
jgi:putative ABC transport system substrate-binding protein